MGLGLGLGLGLGFGIGIGIGLKFRTPYLGALVDKARRLCTVDR